MNPLRWARTRLPFAGALLLATASLGGDCDHDIVDDPTFRDWCGTSLCSWMLDVGGVVTSVATWNEDDRGVSFVTTGTEISQVTTGGDAKCILFTSVADIDPSAQMTLELDFDNDGTIDYYQTLGATAWHKVESEITAPPGYYGITFHIRKGGTGTAILAEMRVQATTGCTAPPPPLTDIAVGDACSSGTMCVSGVCETLFPGYSVCAQCSDDRPCAGGAACQAGNFAFAQCGPGQHAGASGDACLTNSDCQSGTCVNPAILPPAGGDAGACDPNTPAGSDNCSGYTARAGKCL